MSIPTCPQGPGHWKLVICQSYRHWRTGKIIRRADGKPFAFWVRDD